MGWRLSGESGGRGRGAGAGVLAARTEVSVEHSALRVSRTMGRQDSRRWVRSAHPFWGPPLALTAKASTRSTRKKSCATRNSALSTGRPDSALRPARRPIERLRHRT